MKKPEKCIAEAVLLIECERQLDEANKQLKQKTEQLDRLRKVFEELHEVATDLWLYGTARLPSNGKFREAVDHFERVDQEISEQKALL